MKHITKVLFLAVALIFLPTIIFAQTVNYHTVEAGQTVYSISRQYGVSPKDILKLNPNAETSLHPGDKLILPSNAKLQLANIAGTNCKEMYEVQKKDNLYRIALNHNITIEELLAANPDLKADSKLKKGSFLCIPYTQTELKQIEENAAKEKAEKEAAERKAFLSVPHPTNKLRVAVILPFVETDSRASRMIEFYRGLLLAADSVNTKGVNVEFFAYPSGTTVASIDSILAKPEMAEMNIVFGPLENCQAPILSEFCKNHNIRLVLPFATTGKTGADNPYAYIVTNVQDNVQKQAAQVIFRQMSSSNYVFVNCPNSDDRGRNFVTSLMETVQGKSASVQNVQLEDSVQDFTAAFDADRKNVVVMNSIRESNLTRLAEILDAYSQQHPGTRICLLGYPDWLTFSSASRESMYRYDTYVYSTFYKNDENPSLKRVEDCYRNKFGMEMGQTTPSFGLLGFDLGYYFLYGVSSLGASFDYLQSTLQISPLQHKFDFETVGTDKGHVNQHVYLVCFKPNKKIELK